MRQAAKSSSSPARMTSRPGRRCLRAYDMESASGLREALPTDCEYTRDYARAWRIPMSTSYRWHAMLCFDTKPSTDHGRRIVWRSREQCSPQQGIALCRVQSARRVPGRRRTPSRNSAGCHSRHCSPWRRVVLTSPVVSCSMHMWCTHAHTGVRAYVRACVRTDVRMDGRIYKWMGV